MRLSMNINFFFFPALGVAEENVKTWPNFQDKMQRPKKIMYHLWFSSSAFFLNAVLCLKVSSLLFEVLAWDFWVLCLSMWQSPASYPNDLGRWTKCSCRKWKMYPLSHILWSNLGLGIRAWRMFMVQRTADVALEDSVRSLNLVWFWPIRNSLEAESSAACLPAQSVAVGSFQHRNWESFNVRLG